MEEEGNQEIQAKGSSHNNHGQHDGTMGEGDICDAIIPYGHGSGPGSPSSDPTPY